MKELKGFQEKYDFFLIICERAVKKYVPFDQVKEEEKSRLRKA